MEIETVKETTFVPDDNIYDKPIETIPKPQPQIGIDVDNNLLWNIIDGTAVESSHVDLSLLQSFTQVTRDRNTLYDTLDYMSQDTTLASVLETYAEDATETNESGDIVWCESSDPNVTKFVTYLLDSLCVNKNIFKWTLCLCKYGDVYLRLYRESEFADKFFNPAPEKSKTTLNEDINIHAYSKRDKYIHYLEMAHNPAQVFELTRFGKTAGYIKTDVEATQKPTDLISSNTTFINKYRFNSGDVDLFPATEWVHGCLEDDASRSPEEVELFTTEDDEAVTYSVKRGQSLLYDSYKTWRELMLLENSVLLHRVTQSSIVRVIGVEVGDMPKENVQPHLMNVKQLIEQKAAFKVGTSMSEYTNPGPVINNVYIPTRDGKGAITTSQIGGDVNVGELVDLQYYQDKLFGGLRVPKQYFGLVDDAAGFSGGTSLSIISSRYAKMIKRIQNVMIQMLTDAINLILIDTKNEGYINNFVLKMLPPTTQEEVDRRDNISNKVGLVTDIMNTLTDIENVSTKLKILKSLLSNTITDGEVIELLQAEIEALEADMISENELEVGGTETDEFDFGDDSAANDDLASLFGDDTSTDASIASDTAVSTPTETSTLPSPEELGVGDMSDATNPELA